jgi:hypothetical protein
MKRFLWFVLMIAALLLFFSQVVLAQVEFSNGTIRVRLKDYAEIEFFTLHPVQSGLDTLYQIDRLTPLLGLDQSSVFAYREDADNEADPSMVASPTLSDVELTSAINNFYSFEAPDVIVSLNVYGWNDQNFVLVKYSIDNQADAAYDARFGFELIPYVADEYGFETVAYLPGSAILDIFKDGHHVGIKFLSHPMTTCNAIEWFSGYDGSDELLWGYLTHAKIDTTFISTNDNGTVVFPSIDPLNFTPGVPVNFYLALGWAPTQGELESLMATAESTYGNFPSTLNPENSILPESFQLQQNYPNPFNPETKIAFTLSVSEHTRLDIFNARGQFIKSLINAQLPAGSYSINFDASALSSGLYLYTLRAGDFISTHKMLLLK